MAGGPPSQRRHRSPGILTAGVVWQEGVPGEGTPVPDLLGSASSVWLLSLGLAPRPSVSRPVLSISY